MARPVAFTLCGLLAVLPLASGASLAVRNHQRSLMQTWGAVLDKGSARDTPVTRAVNLLKEMHVTLAKEMDQDQALNDKLGCWCNDNKWEKKNSIEAATQQIEQLNATIDSLTAQSKELNAKLKEIRTELEADKKALADATAVREKELKEFQALELDAIQNIENLKAAIVVLSKHHQEQKPGFDSWESLLSLSKKTKQEPMGFELTADHSLDTFMQSNGFVGGGDAPAPAQPAPQSRFLQQANAQAAAEGWSADDLLTVKQAMKTASAFMQAHHEQGYYPSYHAQSGEIMGVLKQLKEEMEGDTAEAQQKEAKRAATFAALREAKVAEIESGEQMEERKEDELAKTDNNLAEAKEDLAQTEAKLSEEQKFMMNLLKTCEDADKNFDERKKARLEEMRAVSEAIEILTQDEARDVFSSTFKGFLQVDSTSSTERSKALRHRVASLLRKAAARSGNPGLAMLASSVELDAFTKVKQAIDDMIAMLKKQQEDEVKKSDWCKTELQENEMQTAKATDLKADIEAKIGVLEEKIKTLTEEVAKAKEDIDDLHMALQRASEDRKAQNLDFQKTIAEQTVTIEVLKKALERLADYYDKEQSALLQTQHKGKQTPPVPQMEYKPSEASTGVMQVLEKLIYDAREIQAESRKAEVEAQAAYEQLVADTNASVAALMREITTKTQEKAETGNAKLAAEADLAAVEQELEGLNKYNADLHVECDYLLRNFGVRQQGRAEEIEALQQAKQILSGADFSNA